LLLPERQAVFTATTCLESRKQYTSCAYLTIKAIGILLAKLEKKLLKYLYIYASTLFEEICQANGICAVTHIIAIRPLGLIFV
jgi:hypothetical protein